MSLPLPPMMDDPIQRLGNTVGRVEDRLAHLESLEKPTPLTGYRFLRKVILTTADTEFVPSATATLLFVEGVAAGGGGGGCLQAATNAAAAGGGGGGAYGWIIVTGPLEASYPVSVGARGTGGTAGANPGTKGGDTTFGSGPELSLEGGSGGSGDTVATIHVGGQGGVGGRPAFSTGDFLGAGDGGLTGFALAAAQAVGGCGGGSHFGGLVRGGKGQGAGNSAAAFTYGSGGAGASIISGGISVAGGDGADGVLVVWEFTDQT